MLVDRVSALNGSAKLAMSMALVIVAGIAMYSWIVRPHVGYLYAVQKYEPVIEKAVQEKNLLDKALGAKRRTLDALRAELAELRVMLFTPEDAQDFFGDMETLCRKAGCAVTSIDFDFQSGRSQAPVAPESVVTQAYQADLTVLGRYDQIAALLNDLQTRPQRVCIDACRIELVDVRSAGLKCELSVTVWVICVGENPHDE